jgi:S-(hydroxymethyl)glutathione dehydrogenase/alcohol dehydrogenase
VIKSALENSKMDVRAAVAVQAGKPLEVMTVQLEGPRAGEVLVEVKATGICHTDDFTLSGADPEGLFPAILGHEGAGIVIDVGPGVTSVKKGDHVIPLYTPECRECYSCLSRKTNLCTSIRATQGQGLMPDGTSRFSIGKDKIHHYMGCSTFANFTVLPEIALAKVNPDAPFDKICYIGCGVTTGIGAVINTAKVEIGSTAIVFGLGGIGLNVLQGLRLAGADMIIGVDINDDRKAWGEKFGMTHFVNPKEVGDDIVPYLVNLTKRNGERRRLYVRLHRQHQGDAPGAGILPSRLGQVGHHRRRRCRPGNLHPSIPACYRPQLDGHRFRRRARPHRCAEDCRLVHGRQDPDRSDDHPHHAARRYQQRLRADAFRPKHPWRGNLLMPTNGERLIRRLQMGFLS